MADSSACDAGRCDYWGPFVNRAARFSNAAAQGGQIMVPAAVGRELVYALTGQQLSLESPEAVQLVHPDFAPQRLQPAVREVPSMSASPLHPRRHVDWPTHEQVRCSAEQPSGAQGCHAEVSDVLMRWGRQC